MTTYVCTQLQNGVCQTWAENQNLLDSLAIDSDSAVKIALAMCSVFVIAWILGEIGHLIKVSFTSRF